MRTAERLARARRAGVPEDLFSAITTPQDRPALLAAREWYKTDKRGLILCGPNQAGKSGAAAAWLSNVDRGLWISAEEIGLAVQPDPENKGVARLRQLREAGALVIDDLFRRCGPAGYETIEGLVLHMLDRGRRVVLTADRPSGDVLALFGEGRKNRIASRWERLGWIKSIESWVTTDPG